MGWMIVIQISLSAASLLTIYGYIYYISSMSRLKRLSYIYDQALRLADEAQKQREREYRQRVAEEEAKFAAEQERLRVLREEAAEKAAEEMEEILRTARFEGPQDYAGGIWDWRVTLLIPFHLIGVDPEALPEKLRANFYKCGDCTAHPHFLSWSPIDTPNPDFHRPDFFGELLLV